MKYFVSLNGGSLEITSNDTASAPMLAKASYITPAMQNLLKGLPGDAEKTEKKLFFTALVGGIINKIAVHENVYAKSVTATLTDKPFNDALLVALQTVLTLTPKENVATLKVDTMNLDDAKTGKEDEKEKKRQAVQRRKEEAAEKAAQDSLVNPPSPLQHPSADLVDLQEKLIAALKESEAMAVRNRELEEIRDMWKEKWETTVSEKKQLLIQLDAAKKETISPFTSPVYIPADGKFRVPCLNLTDSLELCADDMEIKKFIIRNHFTFIQNRMRKNVNDLKPDVYVYLDREFKACEGGIDDIIDVVKTEIYQNVAPFIALYIRGYGKGNFSDLAKIVEADNVVLSVRKELTDLQVSSVKDIESVKSALLLEVAKNEKLEIEIQAERQRNTTLINDHSNVVEGLHKYYSSMLERLAQNK